MIVVGDIKVSIHGHDLVLRMDHLNKLEVCLLLVRCDVKAWYYLRNWAFRVKADDVDNNRVSVPFVGEQCTGTLHNCYPIYDQERNSYKLVVDYWKDDRNK